MNTMNDITRLLQTTIGQFRIVAFLEGLSLLLLIFIAMPLKYIWNRPEFVEHIGMAHGVLFLAYVGFTVYLHFQHQWSLTKRTFFVFLASFLPFGTFVVDHTILKKL